VFISLRNKVAQLYPQALVGLCLTLKLEPTCSSKHWLALNGIHGIIYWKIELFRFLICDFLQFHQANAWVIHESNPQLLYE
jgi:hypothetical protein